MPDPRDTQQDTTRVDLDTFKALSDGYAFVHGQEQAEMLASTSWRDMLQSRIDEIRGPHPYGLPSLLDEVDGVQARFDAVIARLRAQEQS